MSISGREIRRYDDRETKRGRKNTDYERTIRERENGIGRCDGRERARESLSGYKRKEGRKERECNRRRENMQDPHGRRGCTEVRESDRGKYRLCERELENRQKERWSNEIGIKERDEGERKLECNRGGDAARSY